MFTESGKFVDKPGRWFSSVRSLLEMFHCSPTDQPTVVDRERVEVLRIVASRSKVTFTRRHSGEKGEEGDIVMKTGRERLLRPEFSERSKQIAVRLFITIFLILSHSFLLRRKKS